MVNAVGYSLKLAIYPFMVGSLVYTEVPPIAKGFADLSPLITNGPACVKAETVLTYMVAVLEVESTTAAT